MISLDKMLQKFYTSSDIICKYTKGKIFKMIKKALLMLSISLSLTSLMQIQAFASPETKVTKVEAFVVDPEEDEADFTDTIEDYLFNTPISDNVFLNETEEVGPSAEEEGGPGVSTESKENKDIREKLVEYAKSFLGFKYVWGGTTPAGFDCSGLMQYVYKNVANRKIARVSYQQANEGKEVALKDIKKGDLVFYSKTGRIDHVGMYIGDGLVLHASGKNEGVKISPIDYKTPVSIRSLIN